MCDFYSIIVTKEGKILTDISHSHEIIKSKFKLKDDISDLSKLDFYPIEILPQKDKSIFDEPTKENWKLNIGASGGHSDGFIPKWLSNKLIDKIWKKFKKENKKRR